MHKKRFVIQEHTTAEGIHWDLMLEEGEMLSTFRLDEMPSAASRQEIRAEKIFDHPIRFLSYEGPVQQGTGRVRIVARGAYRCVGRSKEVLGLEFGGDTLQGDFTLTHANEAVWALAPAKGPTPG